MAMVTPFQPGLGYGAVSSTFCS